MGQNQLGNSPFFFPTKTALFSEKKVMLQSCSMFSPKKTPVFHRCFEIRFHSDPSHRIVVHQAARGIGPVAGFLEGSSSRKNRYKVQRNHGKKPCQDHGKMVKTIGFNGDLTNKTYGIFLRFIADFNDS